MESNQKIVLISGATGVLGQVLARRFAVQGARLVIIGRSPEKLATLAGELQINNADLLSITADLSQEEQAEKAARRVEAKFDHLDVLINLVGGWTGGKPIEEIPPAQFQSMLDQHFWSTLHLIQACIPLIKKSAAGRILVVSSPQVTSTPAKSAAYVVAKSAQEALISVLAQEIRTTAITANILRVQTIDEQNLRLKEPSPNNASWATPDEICDSILFLCSTQAQRINGAKVPLYGSS